MADELKVTQADREAFAAMARIQGGPPVDTGYVLMGQKDDHPGVQSYARHRIATETRVQATIDELVGAIESASKLEQWIAERAAKIDHARYLESEGDTGKVNPEIDVLANAQFDGMLASYRDEFDTILSRHKGEGEPTGCDQCDGFGMIWNNADPTSGQWAPCPCGDTRGHP